MNEKLENEFVEEPRPPERKLKRIVTYCRPNLHEALKRRARELGMSMTDYVEGLLSKSLRLI